MIQDECRHPDGQHRGDHKGDQPRNEARDSVAFVICLAPVRAPDPQAAKYCRHNSQQSCKWEEDDQYR
jgi:hypothetical protein